MQKMPPSERVSPLMVYMPPGLLRELKVFSKKNRTSVSKIVREGVAMRLSDGDPYNNGFNDGLACAIETAENSESGKFRFPDGKTFATHIEEELREFKR